MGFAARYMRGVTSAPLPTWIKRYGYGAESASTSDYTSGACVGPDGKITVSVWPAAYGLIQLDATGTVVYNLSTDVQVTRLSAGNSGWVGGRSNSGNGAAFMLNASGVKQWGYKTDCGDPAALTNVVAVDPTNNDTYIIGRYNDGLGYPSNWMHISKIASNGSGLWYRGLSGGGPGVGYQPIAGATFAKVDPFTRNLVIGGAISISSGVVRALFACYDYSGTLLWVIRDNGASLGQTIYGIACTATHYYFLVADAATSYNYVIKLDKSGNFVSNSSSYTYATANFYPNHLDADAQGNVYLGGTSQSPAQNVIIKLNSSWALQWERKINLNGATNNNPANQNNQGVHVTPRGNVLYPVSQKESATGNYNIVIASLMPDGTGTGLYGASAQTQYQASTYTAASTPTTPTFTAPYYASHSGGSVAAATAVTMGGAVLTEF